MIKPYPRAAPQMSNKSGKMGMNKPTIPTIMINPIRQVIAVSVI
jgi:hypothetical protein